MKNSNIFIRLLYVANELDNKGLYKEADQLDYILIKLAMSYDEARMILGLGANPTQDEVKSAYHKMALKYHPDIHGFAGEEMMKQLNVAKDVLLEKRKPDRTIIQGPSSGSIFEEISWEDAMKDAGIPNNVEWKFKTHKGNFVAQEQYATGFVIYGQTNTMHVFVSVLFTTEGNKKSYEMETITTPINEPLKEIAAGIINDLWLNFTQVNDKFSKFDGRIYMLPKGAKFTKTIGMDIGAAISLKEALMLVK